MDRNFVFCRKVTINDNCWAELGKNDVTEIRFFPISKICTITQQTDVLKTENLHYCTNISVEVKEDDHLMIERILRDFKI